MRRVMFTPQVRHYFRTMIPVLYRFGYFSYLDGSRKYAKALIDDIVTGLPTCLHRSAPPHFDPEGRGIQYATFRRNRQTTWYVFFTRHEDVDGETVFLVRRIENNHTAAQYF